MSDEQQSIIPPEEAKERLHAAIRERLGDEWDDELSDWTLVSRHDYMARLSNGRYTLDFYVDLLGEVQVEEKDALAFTESGRLTAWLLLVASLIVALAIARVSGFI